jgi:hypothetical protein
MDDMYEAAGYFMPHSMAYIMVGPRNDDGHIGVRFGGSQRDLEYMFQEIVTYLYQAMIISKEQWQAICAEEQRLEH